MFLSQLDSDVLLFNSYITFDLRASFTVLCSIIVFSLFSCPLRIVVYYYYLLVTQNNDPKYSYAIILLHNTENRVEDLQSFETRTN